MKKKLLAGMLGLFLSIRLLPAFSIFWAERISLPLLKLLAGMGDIFPFALLEWGLGAACAVLFFCLFRRKLSEFISNVILAALLFCLVVWYPLYFLPRQHVSAAPQQISALCTSLIDELNANNESFDIPNDLPAKFIRFPQWMDALGITGICSFPTGEALISPALEPVSQPFVAVHEYMHLRGFAGEGAANIAAWEECMSRGGSYTTSARIWALRYGMGILRKNDYALYESCLLRMNHETLQTYREAGGAYSPVKWPEFLYRLHTFLGIESYVQDYEILAHWLAAQYAE